MIKIVKKKHKSKKRANNFKKIYPFLPYLFSIAIIGLIIYGGVNGWFNFIINLNAPQEQAPPPATVAPLPAQPVYSSCSQVCSEQHFSKFYNFIDACKPGESKITYGYPGQTPLLVCCCYDISTPSPTPAQGVCTETDGGNNPTAPGTTIGKDGVARMDVCSDSTTLYEYWCIADGSGDWQGGRHSCDPGQTCLSSRSGGYCKTKSWNDGDTVVNGGGSGIIIGGQEGFASIDLSDYGLATGGNCQLGAQLSVNWNYGNERCTGIQGMAGMSWEFYDSAGLEYSRLDTVPAVWTVDLHPRGHILNWDGHTAWRAYARQTPMIPECLINYQYTVRVYIYDCL